MYSKVEEVLLFVANVVRSSRKIRSYLCNHLSKAEKIDAAVLDNLMQAVNVATDIINQGQIKISCESIYNCVKNDMLNKEFCEELVAWEQEASEWLKLMESQYCTCNICGTRVSYRPNQDHFRSEQKKHGFLYWNTVFESISWNKRTCPVCASMDRERMIALFLDMLRPEGEEKLKILQIAPSVGLDAYIKARDYFEYDTADLFMQGVTYNVDIQDMPAIADNTYDIIICSHILEHVEDDRKAMQELRRILKDTGVCLFLVPLIIGLDKTDEAFGLSSEENWRRFGQDDHARLYSKKDFLDRLVESGFLVHILNESYFDEAAWKEAGLSDIHKLYAATKSDIGIGIPAYETKEFEEELVSVVIPTHNRAHCIEKSVRSVLNQTYKNIEVIVVDDASTDNTAEIVERIKDKRLRYIKYQTNQGANYARNLGIKNANGELIAFNDSDDEWLPEKLEKQMKLFKLESQIMGDELAGVYCVLQRDFGNGQITLAPNMEVIGENAFGNIYRYMQSNMFISTQTLLLRKSVIEEAGFFNESLKRLQDWELLLRIASKYKFSLVQEPLAVASTQADCISHNWPAWIESALYVVKLHDMANNNVGAYRRHVDTIVDILRQFSFSKEYKCEKVMQIAEDGVLTEREIDKMKKKVNIL